MYKHQTYRLLQTIKNLLQEKTFKSHIYVNENTMDTIDHMAMVLVLIKPMLLSWPAMQIRL